MSYIYDLTDTWNAGGTTFNGIKLNVTDSASAVSSKLVTLQTNGTEHFSVTKAGVGYVSGNLGIGTFSPAHKLTVAAATGAATIGLVETSVRTWAIRAGGQATSAFDIADLTAGASRLFINSSGNIGINTATPAYKLDVNGDASFGSTIITGSGVSTGDVRLELGGNRSAAGNVFIDFHALAGQDYNGRIVRYSGTNGSFEITNAGTGAMTFSTNNGERMRINGSNGNVGVGTSNPNYKLEANGIIASYLSGQAGYWTYNGGATAEWFTGQRSGTDHAYKISQVAAGIYTDRVTVDTSGNVGIGLAAPVYQLHVKGLGQDTAAITDAGNKGGSLYLQATAVTSGSGGTLLFGTTFGNQTPFAAIKGLVSDGGTNTTGDLAFSTRNAVADTVLTERMRISASGFLQVGTTTEFPGLGNTVSGISFEPTGSAFFSRSGANIPLYVSRGGDGTVVSIRSSGTEVGSISFSGSTTSFNTSSDVRLKDNIEDADDASSLIDAIQVRKFHWKADGSHQRYGFVAQELVTVAPEAVSQPADPDDMMGVDYSKLVPMLVKEIQSLRARVAQIEGN